MSIRNVKATIEISNTVQSVGWEEDDVSAVQEAMKHLEGNIEDCKLVVGTQYSNEFSIAYVSTMRKYFHDTQ